MDIQCRLVKVESMTGRIEGNQYKSPARAHRRQLKKGVKWLKSSVDKVFRGKKVIQI
jgi:hypothetical protein